MQFGSTELLPSEEGKTFAELYQNILTLVRTADQVGFDRYFFSEHHFVDISLMPSQELIMAAAAVQTSRIKLVPFGFVLNLRNPVRTAETLAMLDNLSNGRVDIGISRGSLEYEFAQLGAKYSEPERREVFQESYEVILAALRDSPFSYNGKHFHYDKLSVLPRPVQKPYPPVWFPGTQSEISIRWAASHGMNTSAAVISNQDARKTFDLYKSYWMPSGVTKEPLIGMVRPIVVGDTDSEARKTGEAILLWWKRFFNLRQYAGLGTNLEFYRESLSGSKAGAQRPWDDFDFMEKNNFVIVGSPETVAKKLLQTERESGINYVIATFQFGYLPIERALKSMELFGKKVIPLFN